MGPRLGIRWSFALLGGVQLAAALVEGRRAWLAWDLLRGGGPAASLALAAQDAWYGALAPLAFIVGLVLVVCAVRARRHARGLLLLGWTLFGYACATVGLWLSGPSSTPEAIFLGALLAAEGGAVGTVSAIFLGTWASAERTERA